MAALSFVHSLTADPSFALYNRCSIQTMIWIFTKNRTIPVIEVSIMLESQNPRIPDFLRFLENHFSSTKLVTWSPSSVPQRFQQSSRFQSQLLLLPMTDLNLNSQNSQSSNASSTDGVSVDNLHQCTAVIGIRAMHYFTNQWDHGNEFYQMSVRGILIEVASHVNSCLEEVCFLSECT